ncbi:MAG TPA: phosphoglycerate kinase [Candidatus Sulfotelmatobacter sp.]|nr:phosphoglycerate kinase [Candidatus Sulfotelmatobacter sp.]
MPAFLTLDDLAVADRRVLVRTDLNLPMKDGQVTDATRLVRAAATFAELAKKRAKVVVLSHFGRPKGPDPKLSLGQLLEPLRGALPGLSVSFAADCIGPVAATAVAAVAPGDLVLLENLRFHKGEEANDPDFVRALAALGDLYVNVAFSTAHRAHASTAGLAALLPAAAGRLMQAELEALGKALEHPERPVVAIVGGAKVSTKLALLGNLVGKVDRLIIGGAMANTFIHAAGGDVGASLCEKELADTARDIVKRARDGGCTIVLPVDGVVAAKLDGAAPRATVPADQIPADRMMLDVGPASVTRFEAELAAARTVVWNGPVGAFEVPPFDAGTTALAKAVAAATRAGRLVSVAGGGDTVAALAHAGVVDQLSYVSTAGGAFLEWLEGKTLPGVAALEAAAAKKSR